MFYDIQLPKTGKGAIFECLCCNWKGEEAIYINNSFITKLGEYLNNSKHVCPKCRCNVYVKTTAIERKEKLDYLMENAQITDNVDE